MSRDNEVRYALLAQRTREAAVAARDLISVLERKRPPLPALRRAVHRASDALNELRLIAAAVAFRRAFRR